MLRDGVENAKLADTGDSHTKVNWVCFGGGSPDRSFSPWGFVFGGVTGSSVVDRPFVNRFEKESVDGEDGYLRQFLRKDAWFVDEIAERGDLCVELLDFQRLRGVEAEVGENPGEVCDPPPPVPPPPALPPGFAGVGIFRFFLLLVFSDHS